MPDWSKTMQQTYEYYVVDPGTWKDVRPLNDVKTCTISRDEEAESLGSVSIDMVDSVGECYIRAYLITIQNGVREKHPLGTFLVQTPATNHDGRQKDFSMDAYTPLIELKEKPPPLGYSILKGQNVMELAYMLVRENARAPVVEAKCDTLLQTDFVSNTSDTWLTYLTDLVAVAEYKLALDEMGRIIFAVEQETASLQPVWTYNDDNSSILYPDVSMKHDLYGIPNVVEVLYARGKIEGSSESDVNYRYARAVNDDPNSPTSTVARGREIVHRVMDPDIGGNPTDGHIQEYAQRLLKQLSSIEYTVTYTHGYCPVRLGDCVRLNYNRAGFKNIKARVVSQSIKCEPGCPVTEKAVFTMKLWG